MLQQLAENAMYGLFVHPVIVVDDENEGRFDRFEIVAQATRESGSRGHLGCAQYGRGLTAGFSRNRLDRRDDIAQELPQVVVLLIQRKPGTGHILGVQPTRHERAFAVSGRSGHQR